MLLEITVCLVSVNSVSSLFRILPGPCKTEAERVGCDLESRNRTNLWIIRADPPSFFFGTIHVPYSVVWGDISEDVMKVFNMSDKIVFEMLLSKVTSDQMDKCQFLPERRNLSSVASPELMQRLQRHFVWIRGQVKGWLPRFLKTRHEEYFNIASEMWQRRRPIWLRESSQYHFYQGFYSSLI